MITKKKSKKKAIKRKNPLNLDLQYRQEYIDKYLVDNIIVLKYHGKRIGDKHTSYMQIVGILKIEYNKDGIDRYNLFSKRDTNCFSTFNVYDIHTLSSEEITLK